MLDYQKLLFVFLLSLTTQIIVYIFVTFLSKKGIKTNYFAIQKIHEGEVPRIGGLLFLSSFLITHFFIEVRYISLIFPLCFSCLLIFIFAFYEDLKQNLSPYFRLMILFLGSLIFVNFTKLPSINISILIFIKDFDMVKNFLFVLSLMLLMNGFNFIDGLNGLSSFNFLSILINIFYLGQHYNDDIIINLSVVIIIYSLIIFLFNFPFGKIFLGDSGSYLYAMFAGGLVIFLFERNPELPTLLSMVILAYPITEMLFSIIRKILSNYSPLKPDTKHLHHLIFNLIKGSSKFKNNVASLLMLPICLIPLILTYYSINYSMVYNFNKFLIFVSIYLAIYFILTLKKG